MAKYVHRPTEKTGETPANVEPSWHARVRREIALVVLILLASALAMLGGTVYRFRDSIADPYLDFQYDVVRLFGLGAVALALWVAVFGWTAARRRRWFRRVNLWAASLAFVAVAVGVMAFFGPDRGYLGAFTHGGEVSLGGEVGSAITGPVGELFGGIPRWLGALRVLGVLALAVSIGAPALAADLAVGSARLVVPLYLLCLIGLRGIFSGITGLYRLRRGHSRTTAPYLADRPRVWPAGRPPVGALPSSRVDGPGSRTTHAWWSPSPVLALAHRAASAGGAGPAVEGRGPSKPPVDLADLEDEKAQQWVEGAAVARGTVPSEPGGGKKFNKYWPVGPGASEPALKEPDMMPRMSAEAEGEGEGDEDAAPSRPILSPAEDLWARPSTSLLQKAPQGGITQKQSRETAGIIERTLAEYGIEVEVAKVSPGPTVTMYGLIPGWVRRQRQVRESNKDGSPKLDGSGKPIVTRVEEKTRVKVDSILSRERDLALALKTPRIRIETPVMGQSMLGIEVPNPNPSLVTLRSAMESPEYERLRAKALLPIALGKGSGGETVVADLARMPHLLIAGATGSGKSVCLNTIISCLILEKTPVEIRLLLIDPKRVELTPFNGIPHLLTPVVVETDQVVGLLKGLIQEMLQRYRRLEEVGVRNIEAYNKRNQEKMPFLVVAIDELADLMMSAAFDIEHSLCRLAQLGRATGIHLIVATQRPSVDVVTGLIKANFPSRISFGVTSQIDSRTILDTPGADKLLGRGDMLYLPLEASRPERVQGVFISDPEVESMVRFWQNTPWQPMPPVSLQTAGSEGPDGDADGRLGGRDELVDKAIEMARHYNKLSTSLLQRRMRIGYPRAARLMDELEDAGIVGPSDGSKSRDVIVTGT